MRQSHLQPSPADPGAKAAAAAAPTAAVAAEMATAATAALRASAAVAATYCEAVMATLPTAAAEAATRRTHTAAKKDVAAMAGSRGSGLQAHPRLPRPPSGSGSTHSRLSRQMAGTGQMCANPQRRLCRVRNGIATIHVLPPPPPPPATPPPPSNPAVVKNLCSSCTASPIFNYERRKLKECLEKLVCRKCFTTSSEYNLNYHFLKYIYEYCQIECKQMKYIPGDPGQLNTIPKSYRSLSLCDSTPLL
jgi:hypothetical protein